MRNTEPLGQVVGRNVRRLRHEKDLTLDDVARIARDLGMQWSNSRVNNIQRGARDPKLSTLLVLARVFECGVDELLQTNAEKIDLGEVLVLTDDLREQWTPCPLEIEPSNPPDMAEWIASRGWGNAEHMERGIWECVDPRTTAWWALMTAERGDEDIELPRFTVEDLHSMSRRCGLTEQRTARALNIDHDVLNGICWVLFDKRTFGEERDRRAAEQHCYVGDVTVELRDELEDIIDGWSDRRLNPTYYPDDQG